MSVKKYTNKIKSIFRGIEVVKSDLAEELRKIDADGTRSGNYKAQQREAAKEKAAELLQDIYEHSQRDITELKKAVRSESAFDYTNPKLVTAMNFIMTAGKSMPAAAAEQIIEDFKYKPAELKYLMTLFEKNGMTSYLIEAQEAVNFEMMRESLPDRLDDLLYYSTDGDPTKEFDFSNIEYEIDNVTNSFEEPEADEEPEAEASAE